LLGVGADHLTAPAPENITGHLTKKNIGHLSNTEILQMAVASGGFLLYNESIVKRK